MPPNFPFLTSRVTCVGKTTHLYQYRGEKWISHLNVDIALSIFVHKVKAPFAEHCRPFEVFRKHDLAYFWRFVWPLKGNIHLSSFVMPALSLYRIICWICGKGGYLSSWKGTFVTYCQTAQFRDNYCKSARLCRWRHLVFTSNSPVLSLTPNLGALCVCAHTQKTVSRESDTTTEFSDGTWWGGMGRVKDGQQGKEHTCLLTDLISALFSTPTKIFKTHHHYGLEGKAVIHALRVNQINCCTAEAPRCAQGERERTGWIIRTVFVQLFVLCALSSEQHTSTNITA